MTADTKAKWEEFLNPALLRSKLISASTFYFNEFRRLAGNPAVQQDPNPDRLQDH